MLSLIQQLQRLLLDINANKVIIRENNRFFTGQEFYDRAVEIAAYFLEQGIVSTGRIAVSLPNSLEFVLCYFACIVGGYTIIPINPALSKQDIDYILTVTNPDLFINDCAKIKYQKVNYAMDIKSSAQTVLGIFFTSGTTNRPKGVCHSTENMLANAAAFNELLELDANAVMLHVLPMGYMAGFLNTILCPILAGGSVIIAPQFNAQNAVSFWTVAKAHKINALWITPTIAALLARLNRDDDMADWVSQHVQHVMVGTAPLPSVTKNLFEQVFKVSCLESYGMTELMLVSGNIPKENLGVSTGRLLMGVEVKTCATNGLTVIQGQEGSLWVKSPFTSLGYWDGDTQSITPLTHDGWFVTGDQGYVDDNNHLFITGRIKDLIIHGGVNISPRAIEEVILQHPDIQDAVIVGKPHPFWGEEVVAFVIMKQDKSYHEDELKQHCHNRLHADAVPSIYKLIDAFPRTSTGKIQTHKLKEAI